MASHPDANPDSDPSGPSDSPEQVSPAPDAGRETVEDDPDFIGITNIGEENQKGENGHEP